MTDRTVRQLKRQQIQRNSIRDSVDETRGVLETAISSDPIDISGSRVALDKLRFLSDQLPALDLEILDLMEDDEEMAAESKTAVSIRGQIFDSIRGAEIILEGHFETAKRESDKASSFSTAHTASGNRVFAKLPKLQITPFSGDVLEWQGFWDSFCSTIHENDGIAVVDKFQYLRSYLKGEALQAIKGYRPTADNYSEAVGVLQEQYGDPETATFAHFEQLFALSSAQKDPSRLKTVYQECEKHIRSLVALGLSEETFGKVFVPLILSKLPRSTQIQLHRNKGSGGWTLPTLRKLMKDEIQARELSDRFSTFFGFSTSFGAQNQDSKGDYQGTNSKGNTSKTGTSKGKPKSGWSTQGSMVSQASDPKCAFCGDKHYTSSCTKVDTLAERKKIIKGKCFKCLGGDHMASDCKRTKTCYFCKMTTHHSSLCPKKFGDGNPVSNVTTATPQPQQQQTGCTPSAKTQTIMMMASVKFPQSNVTARIYLDNGSSSSYVSTKLAQTLKLPLDEENQVAIGRFGSRSRKAQSLHSTQVTIPLRDGSSITINAYVTDTITCPVSKIPLDSRKYPILGQLKLSDTLSVEPEMVEIDILVGGDYVHEITTGERIQVADGLFLYGSKLGYIPAGKVPGKYGDRLETTSVVLFQQCHTNAGSKVDIERFWSIEDIGIRDDPTSDDDLQALQAFQESVTFTNGRYEVALPWREKHPNLASNYALALGRLRSLQQRLKDQPNVFKAYNDILEAQIVSGIIEPVPAKSARDRNSHYIPHHFVLKPDSATTKVRIVYDASAKCGRGQNSLNDSLLRGPVTLQDLTGLLTRFRVNKVAYLCDIEKAFHQVGIKPSDRDMLRFFWLKNPNELPEGDNLLIFRFARVPFGVISSTFLLDATIKYHLAQVGSATAQTLIDNLYVDNVIGGMTNVSSAIDLCRKSKGYFDDISMNLREWYSNSTEFMAQVADKDKGLADTPRVLGLPWDTETDTLSLTGPKQVTICNTKRLLLTAISKVFDPCGFVAPVIILAKFLVQQLWEQNFDWDKKIPSSVMEEFDQIQKDLVAINSVHLNRLINQFVSEPGAINELHCFCDASARAYAAVGYVRSTTPNGQTSTGIAFAKARLAPLKKKLSIPRLELMAAVIGRRIVEFLKANLSLKLSKIVVWCDSKCVLHWLNSAKLLKIFVRNRIAELKCSADIEFRYVPTAVNPADLPTKGVPLAELRSLSIWWEGPNFLNLPANMWPENQFEPDAEADKENLQPVSREQVAITSTSVANDLDISELINPDRFSCWHKLLRVSARLLEATDRFKGQPIKSFRAYITRAEQLWVIHAQSASVAEWTKPQSALNRDLGIFFR